MRCAMRAFRPSFTSVTLLYSAGDARGLRK
jgi:hypothetical protein